MAQPRSLLGIHRAAAGLLLVYAVGSAWWVRDLGRDYRAALLPPAPPPVERLAPTRSDPPVAIVLPVASAPPPANAPAPRATAIPPEPARPADPPPEVAVEPVAPAPVLDPFWDRPDQQRVWDLRHLTAEDERQLGATLHQAIGKLHEPLLAGPLPGRLAAAAEPFLKARSRQDVRYTFTVLDCPEVNAFSHPGGYIYACRGLFDLIAADEDRALEFLVGHEIAHVDQADAIVCLQDPELPTKGLGTSALYCSTILPLAYTEKQELAADRWARQVMVRNGRSKHETLRFLRKLETHAQACGFGNVRMKPFNNPPVDLIDNHIRAHVIPRVRLEALLGQF